MTIVSNASSIILPELAGTPGTVSALLSALETARGSREPSEGAAVALREVADAGLPAGEIVFQPVELDNPCAAYFELEAPLAGGGILRARLIEPVGTSRVSGDAPLVLMFHDAGRPVRGWLHMTRFVALGFAVLALDGGCIPFGEAISELPSLAVGACALARTGFGLDGVDHSRICTWGEGLGGALAVIVAEAFPTRIARCAVLNPFPVDDERVPEHLDAACMAGQLVCELLVGTGLLDEIAPPEGQAALVNRAHGPVRQLFYPKYGHERVNDFENEVLRFLFAI